MKHYDVVVAGAGPSGTVAATLLAREGARVALFDTRAASHSIGETLPGAAARLLEKLNLPGPLNSDAHQPVLGTISAWDGPVIVEDHFSSPDGQNWRLNRPEFDEQLLLTAAEELDYCSSDISGVARQGNCWQIQTNTQYSVTAQTLVDATGRRATVARRLGATRQHADKYLTVWATGAKASKEMQTTNRTLIDRQDNGWWYGAWLPNRQPIAAFQCSPKEANFLRHNPHKWIEQLKRSVVLSKHINPEAFTDSPLNCVVANSSRTYPAAGDNWITCGDAALAFDPLASQGLLNAVSTGAKVASTLLASDRNEAHADYCHQIDSVWNIYLRRRKSIYTRANH